MKRDPHDLERLNKMVSPYQGSAYGGVRPERERMLRAQSRKRRQIRRSEAPVPEAVIWAWVVFAGCMVGLVLYRLGGV